MLGCLASARDFMNTKLLDRVPRYASLLGLLGLIGMAGIFNPPLAKLSCLSFLSYACYFRFLAKPPQDATAILMANLGCLGCFAPLLSDVLPPTIGFIGFAGFCGLYDSSSRKPAA